MISQGTGPGIQIPLYHIPGLWTRWTNITAFSPYIPAAFRPIKEYQNRLTYVILVTKWYVYNKSTNTNIKIVKKKKNTYSINIKGPETSRRSTDYDAASGGRRPIKIANTLFSHEDLYVINNLILKFAQIYVIVCTYMIKFVV